MVNQKIVDMFKRQEYKVNQLDICAIVEKSRSKEIIAFNIKKEVSQIKEILIKPPTESEVYKIISGKGGFSSIALIRFILDNEDIEDLYCSTFRIGKKQINILNDAFFEGKLKNVFLVTSNLQTESDQSQEKYNYYGHISEICRTNKWKLVNTNNHSKIILAKTKHNFYVIETSSNLNENPKIEQFSFENSQRLYEFYLLLFKELIRDGETKETS